MAIRKFTAMAFQACAEVSLRVAMKTVLDLLDPPCPPDALGDAFQGLNLSRLAEIEALMAFRDTTIAAAMAENERVEVDAERENSNVLWERMDSIRRRRHDLTTRASGPVPTVRVAALEADVVLGWLHQANAWHPLFQDDLLTAVGLNQDDSRFYGLQLWPHVRLTTDTDMRKILQAKDACLGVEFLYADCWPWGVVCEFDRPRKVKAERLVDGQLCLCNTNGNKHWRDSLMKVDGGRVTDVTRFQLSRAQFGYVRTFFTPFCSQPDYPDDGGGTVGPFVDLTARGIGDGSRLLTIPVLGEYCSTFFHRDLWESAIEAGWSLSEMRDAHVFLAALQHERLSRQFVFYEARDLYFEDCAAFAPPGEAIVEELSRLRQRASPNPGPTSPPAVTPSLDTIREQCARIRGTLVTVERWNPEFETRAIEHNQRRVQDLAEFCGRSPELDGINSRLVGFRNLVHRRFATGRLDAERARTLLHLGRERAASEWAALPDRVEPGLDELEEEVKREW